MTRGCCPVECGDAGALRHIRARFRNPGVAARGRPVRLSPKAFDLLSLLVAHRPKAMAKSDLQERLWPATFVVEKNLANLIGEIRDAIGDDPRTRDSFGPSTALATRFVRRSHPPNRPARQSRR